MSQKNRISAVTPTETRISNKEFSDRWEEENERDGRYVSPDVLAGERARELRGEPLPEPKDDARFSPGIADASPAIPVYVPALPLFQTADAAYKLPADCPSQTLLRERTDAMRDLRMTDKARFETSALVPADAPRQLLVDAADALVRWGAAAANYQQKQHEYPGKLDEMAAELAAAALAGPEALLTDLRRADRRIQTIGEASASFAAKWRRDRLALLLLATTPGAEKHPEACNPFRAWDPDFRPAPRSFAALTATK